MRFFIYKLLVIFLCSIPDREQAQDFEYLGDLSAFPCPDTAVFKTQLQNGDLDAIYNTLEKFWSDARTTNLLIPIPCSAGISRYQAVLELALKNDSVSAQLEFYHLVKIWRDVEIFDLGTSKAVQDMLDKVKEEKKIQLSDEEMLRRRLLPPPAFTFPRTERLEGMQQKYHDLRTLFAISRNAAQLSNILKSLEGESDPGFVLLNAQITIITGVVTNKIKEQVRIAGESKSEFITEKNITNWAKRLKERIAYLDKNNQIGTKAMQKKFGSSK